jgi:hypothetical protein
MISPILAGALIAGLPAVLIAWLSLQLEPYTGTAAPPQAKELALKPRLSGWTARVWRESPERAIPLFKLEGRLEPRDVENRALSLALRPFAAELQKLTIYLLHPEESPRLAPWAVGRFDVDETGAYLFFHDFLGASNGALMLSLMQTAGAATDIVISVVPARVEAKRLHFAVTGYDLGIHNRIG